jgi:RimJ/RimL family protein N-acetyltransferase
MSETQKIAVSDPTKPLGEVVDVSKPCTAPERIEHHGRYCNLVPWIPAHTEEMFPLISGPENESIFYYWPGDPYPDVKSFDNDMKDWYTSLDPLCWAIIDLKSGKCQGQALVGEWNVKDRHMESGMFLTLPLQKTAAATEAFYLLARYIFELGFRRLSWKTNTVNMPSRRAAERYGMRKLVVEMVDDCSS